MYLHSKDRKILILFLEFQVKNRSFFCLCRGKSQKGERERKRERCVSRICQIKLDDEDIEPTFDT